MALHLNYHRQTREFPGYHAPTWDASVQRNLLGKAHANSHAELSPVHEQASETDHDLADGICRRVRPRTAPAHVCLSGARLPASMGATTEGRAGLRAHHPTP